MTIIQASICDKNKAIILIGDRLVTVSEMYEAEAKSQKLYGFGSFGVGFAGTLSDIIYIKDKVEEKPTFKEFIKSIIEIYKNENTIRENDFIKRNTLLDKSELKEYVIHDEGKIPEDLIEWIYGHLDDVRLDCSALTVGFNEKKKPQIIYIDEFGDIVNNTENYYCTIGSGEHFSEVFFDINEYDPWCTLERGLLFALRAKKSAEAHIGVGMDTDIMVLRQDKELLFILNESNEMRQLEEIYREEKINIRKLFNNSDDKIKGLFNERST